MCLNNNFHICIIRLASESFESQLPVLSRAESAGPGLLLTRGGHWKVANSQVHTVLHEVFILNLGMLFKLLGSAFLMVFW